MAAKPNSDDQVKITILTLEDVTNEQNKEAIDLSNEPSVTVLNDFSHLSNLDVMELTINTKYTYLPDTNITKTEVNSYDEVLIKLVNDWNHNKNTNPIRCEMPQYNNLATLKLTDYGLIMLAECLPKATSLNDFYLLKCIDTNCKSFKSYKESLYKEFQVLQKISHPNIIKFLTYTKTSNYLIFAYNNQLSVYMSYYLNYCKDYHKLGSLFTQFYSAQLLIALEYLHKCGISHNDISPSNMLITCRLYLKLILNFKKCDIVNENDEIQYHSRYISPIGDRCVTDMHQLGYAIINWSGLYEHNNEGKFNLNPEIIKSVISNSIKGKFLVRDRHYPNGIREIIQEIFTGNNVSLQKLRQLDLYSNIDFLQLMKQSYRAYNYLRIDRNNMFNYYARELPYQKIICPNIKPTYENDDFTFDL